MSFILSLKKFSVNLLTWKKLWHADIPPKIRMFGWRALKNALPVKENLVRRGMEMDIRCPVYGEEEETVVHMLLKCHDAARSWYISPLRMDTNLFQVHDLKDWRESSLSLIKEPQWWNLF